MKNQVDLYVELYKEHRAEIRHQEIQRSTVSTICVAFAGALIGLSFQDRVSTTARPYLGLLLLNFSLVAILMLRKLYERFALGKERAKLFLRAIDDHAKRLQGPDEKPDARSESLEDILIMGRDINESKYNFFSFVRLHHLWESLLIGTGLLGGAIWWSKFADNQGVVNTIFTSKWWLYSIFFAGPAVQIAVLLVAQKVSRHKELSSRRETEGMKAAQSSE